MSTLYVFRNSQLHATAQFLDGVVTVGGAVPRVVALVRELLDRDFSENIGFPAVYVQAQRGTPEAWLAVARYLVTNLHFVVVRVECSISVSAGQPLVREAESVFMTRSFLASAAIANSLALLRRAAAVWEARERNRMTGALRYGSIKEFHRQARRAAALVDPRRRRPYIVTDPTDSTEHRSYDFTKVTAAAPRASAEATRVGGYSIATTAAEAEVRRAA